MADRYEGIKCPVCNAYFDEDKDDIVVCPVCGAPHHRECYISRGHCGLEEFHGTDEQFDRKYNAKNEEKPKLKCQGCGKELEENTLFCPHCGKAVGPEPDLNQERPVYGPYFRPFDPLGGINPKTDIDGVTAGEAASFIRANTPRYIPKFVQNGKISWNWLAFLLPHGFFFYHKIYKSAIFVSLAYLAGLLLAMPLQAEVNAVASALPVNSTYADLFTTLSQRGITFSPSAVIFYGVSMILMLALRVFCGLFADRIYRNHVVKNVKKYRDLEPEEREEAYQRRGVPNLFFLLIPVVIFSWIPNILLALM